MTHHVLPGRRHHEGWGDPTISGSGITVEYVDGLDAANLCIHCRIQREGETRARTRRQGEAQPHKAQPNCALEAVRGSGPSPPNMDFVWGFKPF